MAKPEFLSVCVFTIVLLFNLNPDVQAQCYGSLNLDKDYFKYNYIVRLAIHFGNISDIPQNIQCSRTLIQGESPVQVPVYFYNAHGGIYQLGFSVSSCDSTEVIRDSFVECGATDTTFVQKEVEAEITSWGALKSKMRSD